MSDDTLTLEEAFGNLPEISKEALRRVEWTTIIETIGAEQNLTDIQTAHVLLETSLIILGLSDGDEFMDELSNAGIDNEKTGRIKESIEDRVLKIIAQEMLVLVNEDEAQDGEPISPLPTPVRPNEPEQVSLHTLKQSGITLEEPQPQEKTRPLQQSKDNLATAIEHADVDATIQQIGKMYNLHIDTMGVLHRNTTAVLRGTLRAGEFTRAVKSELGVNEEDAQKIIKEINQKVFKRVRDELRALTQPPHSDEDVLEESGITVLEESDPQQTKPDQEFRADIVSTIEDPTHPHVTPRRTKDGDPYLEPIE